MPFSPICTLLGHKVKHRRMWFDGDHYVGPCRRCGVQLIRRRSGWEPQRERNPQS